MFEKLTLYIYSTKTCHHCNLIYKMYQYIFNNIKIWPIKIKTKCQIPSTKYFLSPYHIVHPKVPSSYWFFKMPLPFSACLRALQLLILILGILPLIKLTYPCMIGGLHCNYFTETENYWDILASKYFILQSWTSSVVVEFRYVPEFLEGPDRPMTLPLHICGSRWFHIIWDSVKSWVSCGATVSRSLDGERMQIIL